MKKCIISQHYHRAQTGEVYSIFVGDLDGEVGDYLLEVILKSILIYWPTYVCFKQLLFFSQETFKSCYPSVICARVVTDNITGKSKGYGFVRFRNQDECNLAIQEKNGTSLMSRYLMMPRHCCPRPLPFDFSFT